MTVSEWIALALAVLKFPEQARLLMKMVQDTPQEKHEALLKRIQAEADAFKSGSRPKWD